jgi:CBS domain-containing protein
VQNLEGLTVVDVMLNSPKTLPADATVAEARLVLANPSVEVLLLADEGAFSGAVAEISDGAADDERAIDYAEDAPDTLSPTGSALTAFELAARNPQRRVVVVDETGGLAGLVCLDRSLTRFCGTSRQPAA